MKIEDSKDSQETPKQTRKRTGTGSRKSKKAKPEDVVDISSDSDLFE